MTEARETLENDMKITASLLGTPQVRIGQKEIVFPYRKAEGLFYYLCVRGTVSRDELIGVFWADCAENAARKNLRDAIYHLKRLLGEEVVNAEGNNRIALSYDAFETIDYLTIDDDNIFERFTGEFLGYFYIKNCLEFENWVAEIRDDMLRRFQAAADRCIEELLRERDAKGLQECGQQLIRRHIFEETRFRRLLAGLGEIGARDEAAQLYKRLEKALRSELDDEPEAETRELAASLQTSFAKETGAPTEEIFFCRENEMLSIKEEFYRFRTGQAAKSLLLTGEAGVGKSAILRNLKNSLVPEQYFVISYQCVQTESELYLKPWNDILSQAEELCRELSVNLRPRPGFDGQELDSVLPQYRLYAESILYALTRAAGDRLIVLAIDDVQWLDKASRQLLSSLMLWTENRRIIMVLSGQNDRSGVIQELKSPLITRQLLREISVYRFSLGETETIVNSLRPELVNEKRAVEDIYRATGGNALLLFELLKELRHGGSLSRLSQKTTRMIQSRLENLTEEDRRLLECISLYPRFATMEELEFLTDKGGRELQTLLDHLFSCQLIYEKNTFNRTGVGFPHQMIREYVYNAIPRDRRRALHRQLAEYYEERYEKTEDISLFPMLIYHFGKCDDVCKYYEYQLEYLRMFYSVEHEIYPTVLTNPDVDPMKPRLGGEDELVALAERIRALSPKLPDAIDLRMKAEFLIGRYDLFSGSLKKGLENIHTSILLAKELGNNKYLLENYLQIVFYAIQVHNLEMFNDYLSSCENLLKKGGFSDAEASTVMRLRGVYYMKLGCYDQSEEVFQKLIRRTEERHKDDPSYQVGLAACYNYIGEGCQAKGDLDGALDYYLQAIHCCEGSESVNGKGVFYSNAGYLLYQQGKDDLAQMYIDKAIRCFEGSDVLWGRSRAHSYAALLSIRRKDWKEARMHYEIAKKIAMKGRNPVSLDLLREVEEKLEQGSGQD